MVGNEQLGLSEAACRFKPCARGVDRRVLNVDGDDMAFGADECGHHCAVVAVASGGIERVVAWLEECAQVIVDNVSELHRSGAD